MREYRVTGDEPLRAPPFVDSLRPTHAADSPVAAWSARFRLPPPPPAPYGISAPEWFRAEGKGWSDEAARASCLGEAVERRSAMFRGDEPRRLARYRELGPSAVSPATLLQYSPAQYEGRCVWNAAFGETQEIPEPWREDDLLEWTACRSLVHGCEVLVPTAACYLRYAPPEPRLLFPGESTGFAAAPSLEEASLRAFLEVVERDAVAIWWYNRCPRPPLDLSAFEDSRIPLAADYLRARARTLDILDLTTDFAIPVAAAVSATTEGEAILFGVAADFSPLAAARRAVAELFQILGPADAWTRAGMLQHYDLPLDRKAWIMGATTENQRFVVPAAAAPPPHPASPPPAPLSECLRRARHLGLDVLLCDVTRPDSGMCVAKIIVPGARSSWAHLGAGRLYDVPSRLGWLAAPRAEGEMNPFPFFL